MTTHCNACFEIAEGDDGGKCGRDLTDEINQQLDLALPEGFVRCPGFREAFDA